MTTRLLKRFSYTSPVTDFARWVGLAPALRSLYYRCAAPGGRVKIEVSGVRFNLYAKIPKEVRWLEGSSLAKGTPWSEGRMLEAFLAFLGPGDIVYDVGANFGLYSIASSKKVTEQGEIIAFEPLSRNFQRLQANIQLNGLKNVRCFAKAFGEHAAKAEMYINEERPWQSTLLPKPGIEPIKTGAIEVVEVVEGDSFRLEQGLPMPRAVKIDVEGFEHSVICGLRQTLADPRCRLLGCEVHPGLLPAGIVPEQVVSLVRSLGFTRIDVLTQEGAQHVVCYKE